ncbi:unnamed protein product [Rotaria sp. Silwood2]|nr:unnamed protein product [Rotaria sp. Silwood2]
MKQCDHDLTPISILLPGDYSKRDLNELDPSFMYSQVLKEILLSIKHNEHAKQTLVELCREQYHGREPELRIIDEFERDYNPHSAIWWYTRECFTYKMLNHALRTMDSDIVIKLGFFLCDLHRQIEQLCSQQSSIRAPLTVYRGQRMLNSEFEKLLNNKGGLLSFNNFLSTSTNPELSSVIYAATPPDDQNMTAIRFEMKIDPALASTPFASLDNVNQFEVENEILFSMHTVFRIGEMNSIENRLWKIELTLTADDDPQLKMLTERLRKETDGFTGWYRLDYPVALSFFQKALENTQTSCSEKHPDLAIRYTNIGDTYRLTGDYSTAISFHQKALEIQENISCDPIELATTYNNFGETYREMKEYSTALIFHKKALEIREKRLPSNHPDLAVIHHNISNVYRATQQHSVAIEHAERAVEIAQLKLPEEHPYAVQIRLRHPRKPRSIITMIGRLSSICGSIGLWAKI